MKKKLIAGTAIVATGLIATVAWAAATIDVWPIGAGCLNNNNCYVMISPALTPQQTSCANKDQIRFSLSATNGEGMYQTALTALGGGRKLAIGTSDTCVDGFPGVTFMHMH